MEAARKGGKAMARPDDAAARAAKSRKVWALAYACLAKRRQARMLRDTVLLAVLRAALEEEQTRAPIRKVCHACIARAMLLHTCIRICFELYVMRGVCTSRDGSSCTITTHVLARTRIQARAC